MLRISSTVVTCVLLASFAGAALADSTADLIALDRQWGEAGAKGDAAALGNLFADEFVSVDETGVRGKQDELAATKPDPEAGPYEPTDYTVTFLGEDTAIMTHGTKGKDAHHSLHVWARKGGQWRVVATSSTPAKTQ